MEKKERKNDRLKRKKLCVYDLTIDFIAYCDCKRAVKKLLCNSGFSFCNNNVMNVAEIV